MAKKGQPPAFDQMTREELVRALLAQQQQQPAQQQQQPAQQRQQAAQQQPVPPDVRGAIRRSLERMLPGGVGVPMQLLPHDGAVILGRAAVVNAAYPRDDINDAFSQYFRITPHAVLHNDPADPDQRWRDSVTRADAAVIARVGASTTWALDSFVVRGRRGIPGGQVGGVNIPAPELQRVFAGDLVWLFFWERLGTFRMLGALLDDYATLGRFPLRSDDPDGSPVYFETMVRLTKMGLASSVRERDSSYRRCLGWTSDDGRSLRSTNGTQGSTIVKNTAFNTQFHRFLELALTYYKEKRLISAISNAAGKTPPSLATLESIMEVIRLLQSAMLPFAYGRNHLQTVSGVTWLIAALDLVKRVRQDIGVPAGLNAPHQYVPAAIEVLLGNGNPARAQTNRYTLHKQCAENARAILLDIEALEDATGTDTDYTRPVVLSIWLDSIEAYVEAYRAAYKATVGSDIATPGAAIEQAA